MGLNEEERDPLDNLPKEYWEDLEKAALERELHRTKHDYKINRARMLLDAGKITMDEFLIITKTK